MSATRTTGIGLLLLVLSAAACQQIQPEDVVVYTSLDKSVVAPFIQRFVQNSQRSVSVQYGTSQELTAMLTSSDTEADLFWAEDVGSLDTLLRDTALASLPDSLLQRVPPLFQGGEGRWVATSVRPQVLVYPSAAEDTLPLPATLADLADSTYRQRLGIVPSSSTFQATVAGLRGKVGSDSTRSWLQAIQQGARVLPDYGTVLNEVASGRITYGLVSAPALYRFQEKQDTLSLAHTFFSSGDVGNVVEVTGVALLEESDQTEGALAFISFLLSQEVQQQFFSRTYALPVRDVPSDTLDLPTPDRLQQVAPALSPRQLNNAQSAQTLLKEVGLL